MNAFRSLLPAFSLALLAGCATEPIATAPSPAEASALAVLSSSADVHEKARACQELAVLAGPASVPALAGLLNDDHLSDYARSGLEAIQHPAAGAALRDALRTLEGRRLAGVVFSLGVRREKTAVADLRALALDPRRGVAAEALAALGMIGTPAAADVLEQALTTGDAKLRLPAAHAALDAAAQLARQGSRAAARKLLERVVQALPSTNVAAVAQSQAAALGGSPTAAVSR